MKFTPKKEVIYEIIYCDANNKISQRHIRVIEVKGELIRAYCYTRKQVRLFTATNVLGWKVINGRTRRAL